MAAVHKDAWALEYASDAMKGNESVVLTAVQQDGKTLEYASTAKRCVVHGCSSNMDYDACSMTANRETSVLAAWSW